MLNKLSHFFMRRRNWTVPYALFLLVFVIVPLLLIVLYAFTDDGGAFTLANFRKFMMHPEAMNTFVYSIGIAVITTLVCLLLGYPAAYILSQKQFNTSRTMVVLFILPSLSSRISFFSNSAFTGSNPLNGSSKIRSFGS